MRGGAVLATLVVLAGCTTAPYTHRSQLMLVSPEQETKLGAQAYQQVLAPSRRPTASTGATTPERESTRLLASTCWYARAPSFVSCSGETSISWERCV